MCASACCSRAVCRRSEQDLDHTNIDVLLEQVGGEAVSQRVRCHPIGQPSQLGGHVAGAVELARGHRVDAVAAGEHPHWGMRDAPPVAQQLQQLRRQLGLAILVAFALLHAEYHAPGINIADLQRDHLHGPQTGAVGNAERRLMLGSGCGLQQAQHLFGREHARQFARLVDEHETARRLRPVERHLEEERSAVTVALMLCGCKPVSVRCSWNARSSSGVALSGERPRKLASFLTARIYSRCVSGTNRRMLMSSSMRWRSGLMGFSLIGGSCLEVGVLDPSILKTERPPVTCARSNGYCGRCCTPDRAASALPRERVRCVLGMLSSLEVKVFCPT